jgi:tRNA pseudouridine32 synthase / 23S rRNA pseudouridine746 synthase
LQIQEKRRRATRDLSSIVFLRPLISFMSFPLPYFRGIAPSRKWLPAGGRWETVGEFLGESFPEIDFDIWLKRIERGLVADETGSCLTADSPYRAGSFVFYYREVENEAEIPFHETVIYRDEEILIADKPHFLPVSPTGRFVQETLLTRLRNSLSLKYLAPLHRIDRETAGLVLFSVNPDTSGLYSRLFQSRAIEKTYEAVAPCLPQNIFPLTRRTRIVPGEPFFRMKEIPGDANSSTLIEIKQQTKTVCLYRIHARTGKKHQIRVHFSALGIPVKNDKFYPVLLEEKPNDFSEPLQLLAKSLSYVDPLTGAHRLFSSSQSLQP